jgi:hypothetical protein
MVDLRNELSYNSPEESHSATGTVVVAANISESKSDLGQDSWSK